MMKKKTVSISNDSISVVAVVTNKSEANCTSREHFDLTQRKHLSVKKTVRFIDCVCLEPCRKFLLDKVVDLYHVNRIGNVFKYLIITSIAVVTLLLGIKQR